MSSGFSAWSPGSSSAAIWSRVVSASGANARPSLSARSASSTRSPPEIVDRGDVAGGRAPPLELAEQLDRVKELVGRARAAHAVVPKQRVVDLGLASQPPAVRQRQPLPTLAAPDLQRHDRHIAPGRLLQRRREPLGVAHRLDEAGHHLRLGVVEHILEVVGQRQHRLVAAGDQVVEAQPTAVAVQRREHRAAVGDQRGVALRHLRGDGVARDRQALRQVGEAHAVWPAQPQVARHRQLGQPLLQRWLAGQHRRGEDHRRRDAQLDQRLAGGQQVLVADRQDGAVGALGQVVQRRVAGLVVELRIGWVDAIDRAGVAKGAQVGVYLPAKAARLAQPDDRDRARLEQRAEIAGWWSA